MPKADILIVDGPAGAGKSTLIAELVERGVVKEVHPLEEVQISRPREYDDPQDNGATLSLAKDHANLAMALRLMLTFKTYEKKVPIILDRGFVGQYVYGLIRQKPDIVFNRVTRQYVQAMYQELEGLWMSYQRRFFGTYLDTPKKLNIKFAFYIPPVRVIKSRRDNHTTLRRYPFDAQQEYSYYRSIQQNINWNPINSEFLGVAATRIYNGSFQTNPHLNVEDILSMRNSDL